MTEYTKQDLENYLLKLKERFKDIEPEKYFLSYSGGRDSHFIWWFLRVWLKDNDPEMYEAYKAIKIVSVNTRMEHPQILERMNKNADIVLIPGVKPFDYKREVGIPCFTKMQDSAIRRYQKGNRSYSTMKFIHGIDTTRFKLNQTAKEALLNGTLHKVGDCCKLLKKDPFKKFSAETGLNSIMGVRQAESLLRKVNYKGHIMNNGKLTPIFDLEEDMLKAFEKEYDIEVPALYKILKQSGCMGCPYGRDILSELQVLPKNQRDFTIKLFKESYDVKGVRYDTLEDKAMTEDEIIELKKKRKSDWEKKKADERTEETE